MDIEWYMILAVIGVGFLAGFINTFAGSGSLMTLPLLISLGMPATVANGTNRIGILLQSLVGVSGFKQQKLFRYQDGIRYAIPAIIGSLIGAQLAVEMDEVIMKRTIAALLIIMFFVILMRPNAWIKNKESEARTNPRPIQYPVMFLVGVYGGFIQAGVGLFLLMSLVLCGGFDAIRANAIKLFIILLFTIVALPIFIYHNQIDYVTGFILAAGNMAGTFVATKYAVNLGVHFVRKILLLVLFVASLHMFGLTDYVIKILNYE